MQKKICLLLVLALLLPGCDYIRGARNAFNRSAASSATTDVSSAAASGAASSAAPGPAFAPVDAGTITQGELLFEIIDGRFDNESIDGDYHVYEEINALLPRAALFHYRASDEQYLLQSAGYYCDLETGKNTQVTPDYFSNAADFVLMQNNSICTLGRLEMETTFSKATFTHFNMRTQEIRTDELEGTWFYSSLFKMSENLILYTGMIYGEGSVPDEILLQKYDGKQWSTLLRRPCGTRDANAQAAVYAACAYDNQVFTLTRHTSPEKITFGIDVYNQDMNLMQTIPISEHFQNYFINMPVHKFYVLGDYMFFNADSNYTTGGVLAKVEDGELTPVTPLTQSFVPVSGIQNLTGSGASPYIYLLQRTAPNATSNELFILETKTGQMNHIGLDLDREYKEVDNVFQDENGNLLIKTHPNSDWYSDGRYYYVKASTIHELL